MKYEPYTCSYLKHRFYYWLRHPLHAMHSIFITTPRNWYWRIRYGWCPSDVWNYDEWCITILANALEYLARHHNGYPTSISDKPESYEEENADRYAAWLWGMRDKLLQCRESYWDKLNPYEKQMMEWIDSKEFNIKTKEQPEFMEHYYEEAKRLGQARIDHITSTFKELGEHLLWLWD